MMNPRLAARWSLLLLTLLLAPVVAHAQIAPPAISASGAGFLTNLQNQFQGATTGWMTQALTLAKGLFVGLAGLDIAWTGINWLLKKNDLSDFIAAFVLKMLSLAFFYMLLAEAPTWIPMIITSFKSAGSSVGAASLASASPALDPSTVFGQGFRISNAMWTAEGKVSSFFHPFDSVAYLLGTVIASIMVMAAYALLAVQILITNVESYIIIGGGALLLGFNGSKWTQPFAEKYFGYAFSIGIKLFVLYLITGLGQSLADGWITVLNGYATNPGTFALQAPIAIGVSSLVYGAMGVTVPGIASSMLNGSPSMSLGNTMGAAAGVAGGVAGAGAAAVAGYAGAVGAAQGGLNKMAGLVGAGSGGSGTAAGGIGGADKLASLGAMTGAGGTSAGSIGGSKPGTGSAGSVGGDGKAPGGSAAHSGAPSKGVADAGQMGNSGAGAGKDTVTPNTAATGAKAHSMMTDKLTQGQLQTGPTSPISARLKQDGQSGAGASAASSSASPTAPATGGADSLGAPNLPTGAGGDAVGAQAGEKGDEGKSPWNVMKDGLGRAAGTKDDIARHEGGGGGIQIRLGHSE
jgi:type IV secretion system protein TrbL